MKRCIRDWWRGWSDEDWQSYQRKVVSAEPGMAYPVTKRELRASLANGRRYL